MSENPITKEMYDETMHRAAVVTLDAMMKHPYMDEIAFKVFQSVKAVMDKKLVESIRNGRASV